MNTENWEAWLHDLETTDAAQISGQLRGLDDDSRVGYCCLGRACAVKGLTIHGNGYEGMYSLLPVSVVVWLGIDPASDLDPTEGYDLLVDWPEDLHAPNGVPYLDGLHGATDLNDTAKLTFAQIADVFRHFGCAGVR